MLFFRSEEHLRNWEDFSSEKEEGIISLPDLVSMFSADFFRRRMDPDSVSRMREYLGGVIGALIAIGKVGPYWLPKRA